MAISMSFLFFHSSLCLSPLSFLFNILIRYWLCLVIFSGPLDIIIFSLSLFVPAFQLWKFPLMFLQFSDSFLSYPAQYAFQTIYGFFITMIFNSNTKIIFYNSCFLCVLTVPTCPASIYTTYVMIILYAHSYNKALTLCLLCVFRFCFQIWCDFTLNQMLLGYKNV